MHIDSKRLGSLLMTASLVFTGYIYYPILLTELKYRLHSHNFQTVIPKSSQFSIQIPKIGVNELVFAHTSPINKLEYLPILNQGIAHATGSSLPGEPGHIYLFGHSSDNPFSITRYNTSFYLLDKLIPGDTVTLTYRNQTYNFQVDSTAIVSPAQSLDLIFHPTPQLILQTCTPIGTSLKRLLVFAHPVD